MGIEENKATIQRLFDEVFNKGDYSLIPELVSPNLVVHVIPEYRGHDGLRQHILETGKSFSEVQIKINHLFAEGDMVAWSATLTGTHSGEFVGIAPTGKKISATAIAISRMEDGKEAERWQGQVMGELTIYQQLVD